MILAGLTGGIASGKSTVSNTLKAAGIFVVDADQVARDVVDPYLHADGLMRVIQEFGSQYLLSNGTLDRKSLGDLVFHNRECLDKLNHLMMPLIQDEAARQIRSAEYYGYTIIVFDGALICEMGDADKYRPLIVVRCTEEQQLDRLMKRNDLTYEQAMARIQAQMPVKQKIAMADFIIDTSGSKEESIKETKTTILCLKVYLRNQRMVAEGKR